ncbi:hypothetical protein Dtox_0951 [Desulfofarcimen acetoxidans DSM 771]|uniref:Uncharacterized protein n=1 Tax=Desulfofarcimen acetoxidans (strain ATCC 49208 / DSM 771 / KCTC 5769 / VKM B-1644 / 5575) TaxID=485916 RepID=C8W374_DESAS|nr:hypothetical protein [Desulfofarcimen acetoxidans]ACV61841.1 hypothetical protein Dtox_0951 [Desulfofarcimen acetoxidans DSM 771]
MKKHSLLIVLAIICLISISINVLSVVNYNNAKKSFLYDTYSHLANISKLLDNMAYSISNDDVMINYNLSTLERECIQLDDSIRGLSALSPHNITSYKFENFNKMISSAITANYNSPEKAINDITQHKERIQELIRKLSPKEEISDNEYGELSLTPNYSLSVKQIINSINDTLANVPPS